jgi:hypothetical protein
MAGRIASLLDGFILQCGWDEFSKDRLSVVIRKDYTVCITEKGREKDYLLAVPLTDLSLQFSSNTSGIMRDIALDMAASTVMRLLPRSD